YKELGGKSMKKGESLEEIAFL
ncbi:hypothetical protein Z485_01236, partial [Streptococcus pyogenes ABC020048184]